MDNKKTKAEFSAFYIRARANHYYITLERNSFYVFDCLRF